MPDYSIPSFTVPSDGIKIDITIPQTQATVVDQSHTYNEAGMTYNQAGVKYGGIQGANQDVVGMDLSFTDIYTTAPTPPPPNSNHSVGPGWFMYVTIP